jgi:hypothetical protein
MNARWISVSIGVHAGEATHKENCSNENGESVSDPASLVPAFAAPPRLFPFPPPFFFAAPAEPTERKRCATLVRVVLWIHYGSTVDTL